MWEMEETLVLEKETLVGEEVLWWEESLEVTKEVAQELQVRRRMRAQELQLRRRRKHIILELEDVHKGKAT